MQERMCSMQGSQELTTMLADSAAQTRGWHNALQKKCAEKTGKKPFCEQNVSKESGTWDGVGRLPKL